MNAPSKKTEKKDEEDGKRDEFGNTIPEMRTNTVKERIDTMLKEK